MYIENIVVANFKNFQKSSIEFLHPDRRKSTAELPVPSLRNVNLILGDNGSGKTSLLRAVALTCLGPAVSRAGIYPYRFVRRDQNHIRRTGRTSIEAKFQVRVRGNSGAVFRSRVLVHQKGDLEYLEWDEHSEDAWSEIYHSNSESFFFVGYGALRKTEDEEFPRRSKRDSEKFARAQRVGSLFSDTDSLIPLESWLPQLKRSKRFSEIVRLINNVLESSGLSMLGSPSGTELMFRQNGIRVPLKALSDGYQTFLGWVGDLIYQMVRTSKRGTALKSRRGIVMVDEVDLHLHPSWQMDVLEAIAKALPNIQFIFTTHSPLLVGSLEWPNTIVMEQHRGAPTEMTRIREPVHGLNADQVLLTDFFGLKSTSSSEAQQKMKDLSLRASKGDGKAALELLSLMASGLEAV